MDLSIKEDEAPTYKKIFYITFSYLLSVNKMKNIKIFEEQYSEEFIEGILKLLLDNNEQSEDDIYLRGIKLLEN